MSTTINIRNNVVNDLNEKQIITKTVIDNIKNHIYGDKVMGGQLNSIGTNTANGGVAIYSLQNLDIFNGGFIQFGTVGGLKARDVQGLAEAGIVSPCELVGLSDHNGRCLALAQKPSLLLI